MVAPVREMSGDKFTNNKRYEILKAIRYATRRDCICKGISITPKKRIYILCP